MTKPTKKKNIGPHHADYHHGQTVERARQSLSDQLPGPGIGEIPYNLTATMDHAQYTAGVTDAKAAVLVLDPDNGSITYRGQKHMFGDTDSFRIFQCLAACRDHHVTERDLRAALRHPPGEMRFKIAEMKKALDRAGLGELSERVSCGRGGSYVLQVTT